MTNYILIEKNTQTVETVQDVLDELNHYQYLGTAADYDASMNLILNNNPDIIFINIDDTINSPFQFIQEIEQYTTTLPTIIALSNSSNKAYEAIKNNVYDFLLTPLNKLDIKKSLLKFQKKKSICFEPTICLKSYNDFQYLKTNTIIYLKADNNATDFYLEDGSVISAFKTLKTFEFILPKNFARIHKSYIINTNYISRIQFGKHLFTMTNVKDCIPFSNSYVDSIKEMNSTLKALSIKSIH